MTKWEVFEHVNGLRLKYTLSESGWHHVDQKSLELRVAWRMWREYEGNEDKRKNLGISGNYTCITMNCLWRNSPTSCQTALIERNHFLFVIQSAIECGRPHGRGTESVERSKEACGTLGNQVRGWAVLKAADAIQNDVFYKIQQRRSRNYLVIFRLCSLLADRLSQADCLKIALIFMKIPGKTYCRQLTFTFSLTLKYWVIFVKDTFTLGTAPFRETDL